MDYELLLCLNATAEEKRNKIPPEAQSSFDNSFNIEYAHNSTAIEGNTLTLNQTKAIIEDGLSPAYGKEPREVYEVANHAKAFAYVQKCVSEGRPLDEISPRTSTRCSWKIYRPAVCTEMRKYGSPAQDISIQYPARCTVRLKNFLQTCHTRADSISSNLWHGLMPSL